jgi:3-deoxy-D-manno-octulosonic-acid transferase
VSLPLYSLAWRLGTPLTVGYLLARSMRQPAYRRHWRERFGWFEERRSDRPLIWIHAVSVGETRAAQPLIEALMLECPGAEYLLTHMTPTGREAGRALFGDRLRQAYLPYDLPDAQRRFLRAWRPSFGVLLETELWPNLMSQAQAAGVPIAMVSARLSERSLRRGLRYRRLVLPAARRLALLLAQSEADAARLATLGRPADGVTGNLKFDNRPAPAQVERGLAWRARAAGRPVVLAASTRDGEEALLLEAWRKATAPGGPDAPLLAIVPRHPQRFEEVSTLLATSGLRHARRVALDDVDFDWRSVDVVLGDSMGEMAAWYALADAAIIGGSLLPYGAQNLIEACAAGCPVLVGPHDFNFAEAARAAIDAGAAIRFTDALDAVTGALSLVVDPAGREACAAAGRSFADAHRGATARTLQALAPLLARVQAQAEAQAQAQVQA